MTRNHARPLAPSDLAWSVSSSSRAREKLAPPGTRIALTVGAEKALTSVVGEDVREIVEQHREAQVGLVGAVAIERLGPGHRRDVLGPHAGRRFGRVEHGERDEAEDVVLVDEARLHVELRELELSVGAQVLVAHAARDLVVAIEAADHQELLGDLGTLRQDVELAGLQARRHDELARALRRRRPEQRRLDLAETLRVHGASNRAR